MTNTFQENDIRPLNFKEKQNKVLEKDIEYLLSNKADFVRVNCPACGEENDDVKFCKNGFEYVECSSCTMLYIPLRPSFETLKDFYANSVNYKFFNDYIFPSSLEVRREKIFIPRVKNVLKICEEFNVPKTNILEIGAGYGIFLEEMMKKNLFESVMGVEASDSLYERSNKMGFSVYNGVFEELEIDRKFSVIVSFEVIEHIFNPKQFIKKIFKVLENNGILIMTFPNYNGFDISTLMEVSDSVDHEHLNYFNESSITMLLSEVGFKNIEISTPGVMDVDLVRNKIIEGSFKPNPFIQDLCASENKEVGDVFQQFLIDNKLSSNMMVLARKI